jgi:DNA-binding NarL/FixJ family response regulator
MATRIVVADQMSVFRSAVRSLLEREGDFETAEARDLDELVDVVERQKPEIALIDLDLPPAGGIKAVVALGSYQPITTIIWSFEPQPSVVLEAIRANAGGYLRKDIAPGALARALRGASHGEPPLSRALTASLLKELRDLARRQRARERAASLSSRECDVLALVARGYGNKQIAASLFISEFTVKRHIHNILEKLDQRSRTAAAAIFREAQSDEEAWWALERA